MELRPGQFVHSPVFNQLYLVLSPRNTFIDTEPHIFVIQLTRHFDERSPRHRAFCYFSPTNRGIITDYLVKNLKRFQRQSAVSIQYKLRALIANSSDSTLRVQYLQKSELTLVKDKDHLLSFIGQTDAPHSPTEIKSITLLYDNIPRALHSFTPLPTSSPL